MKVDKIIDLIIKYYKYKDPKILINNVDISTKDLNVVVIEILSWLKLEAKREKWLMEGKKTSLKPLILNDDFTWCKNLKALVEKEDIFKANFKIINNMFDFSENISTDEKHNIREKAFKEYNPLKRS